MKKRFRIAVILVLFSITNINGFAQTKESKSKSKRAAEKWFKAKDWAEDVHMKPHKSIDVEEFAKQYRRNKASWDKAFAFLKDHDLQKLTVGKYPIDSNKVFATITQDSTKEFDKTNWESNRKYIDLQSVISGEEKIGVCPITDATVIKSYDEKRDAANYTATGRIYKATPGTFFIFFPRDAHRRGITAGGNAVYKKIVIKIKVAD